MENVLLDRSSRSLEFPKRPLPRSRRGPAGARPAAAPAGGSYTSFPMWQPYNNHQIKGGAWTSAPALPYARPAPAMIYSSPSLPLLMPSNQPPLLPLPPTATKHATFPGIPVPAAAPPPAPRAAAGRAAAPATTTAVSVSAAAPAPPRQNQKDRRRRPARPPPPPATTVERPAAQKKKKPLERATPLPPAPVVTEAIDDLEQEVARNFVENLLHVLAPPPSSLPLPSFSLVVKASSSPAAKETSKAVAPPSCNVEAAGGGGIRGLLRL